MVIKSQARVFQAMRRHVEAFERAGNEAGLRHAREELIGFFRGSLKLRDKLGAPRRLARLRYHLLRQRRNLLSL